MPLEWNKGMSTGVPWQDRQHKELFKRINKLLDAMEVGLGKEEVARLFQFLDEYIVVHFAAEEKEMDRTRFPGTIQHLGEHTRFIEEMARLRAEFEKSPTSALVMQVKRRVLDWLISHIGEVDKKFGEFAVKAEGERKGRV